MCSSDLLVTTFGKPASSNYKAWYTAANFLSYGNNLQVVRVCDQSASYNAKSNAAASAVIIRNQDHYTSSYSGGEGSVGEWAAKYPGSLGNSLKISMADGNTWSSWGYASSFDAQPTTSTYVSDIGGSHDELHIAVIDALGSWTGTAGTVLEKFEIGRAHV